jgi:hypothetical protein
MIDNSETISPDTTPLAPPASISSIRLPEEEDWAKYIPQETWRKIAKTLSPKLGYKEEDLRREQKRGEASQERRRRVKEQLKRGF